MQGEEDLFDEYKRLKRRTPEQIVSKLRDADAMLNAGKKLAVILQTLEVRESTYERWRKQYGGMKSEEAKRLKELEKENKRLKSPRPQPKLAKLLENTHPDNLPPNDRMPPPC